MTRYVLSTLVWFTQNGNELFQFVARGNAVDVAGDTGVPQLQDLWSTDLLESCQETLQQRGLEFYSLIV